MHHTSPMSDSLLLSNYAVGFTLIGLVVTGSAILQHGFKRRIGSKTIKELHEVGGHYMTSIGTLYAVLLGLIVVDASSKFNEAKNNSQNEANALYEVYALADRMPFKPRLMIRSTIHRYTSEVMDNEWDLMSRNQSSQTARDLFRTLMEEIKAIEPVSENQKAVYQTLLTSFIGALEFRRGRLNFSQYAIPDVEWFSLISGGVITIVFTFFFALENHRIQAVMTAMVAFVLAVNLYLAYLFSTPYSGSLNLPKESFLVLQSYIEANPP